MALIDFGGTTEDVVTRKEFPMARARKVLKKEVIAIIGYGVQGPAQGLNLRDKRLQRHRRPGARVQARLDRAVADGWTPGKTLFPIAEAIPAGHHDPGAPQRRGAAERCGPRSRRTSSRGRVVLLARLLDYLPEETGVVPPKDVDVILVAPKGSGLNVRRQLPLRGGQSIRATPCQQDATGRAKERCLAVGIGIGSGYLFPTTFAHETNSDLTGERGVLMGALAGIMEAQYDVLRAHGHSPSEASTKPSRN